MEGVEGKGPFLEFTDEDIAFLLGLGPEQKELRNFVIRARITKEAEREAARLWSKVESELQKAESHKTTSLLPYADYSLVLDSGLPSDEQWSAFNAAMNPEMPPKEGLPSEEWMNKSIKYQTYASVLSELGFTSDSKPLWETVKSKEMQVFYIGVPKVDNLYLVRTSQKMPDGKSLLTEKLVYAPSEEALRSHLLQEPSGINVSPSH